MLKHPWLKISALAALVCAVSPSVARAQMIEVRTPGGERYTSVNLTQAALVELVQAPGAQVREVTYEEAAAEARVRGIELPVVGPEAWGKPWFLVKGGIGLPNLVNAEVEVFVHPNWTVSAGYGAGLLPSVFSASVRWRPDATCFGCDGRNLFSIGFGIDGHVAPNNGNPEGLITASADAFYLHRFAEHFGWLIGMRLGIGPTIGGRNGPPEPGINVFLYTGFAF